MQKISQKIDVLKEISKKYNVKLNGLDDIKKYLDNFVVTVPFIGSFNTGKSSAINALLGKHILPASITAETSVPCEIIYSDENTLWIERGSKRQRGILRDLKTNSIDSRDVTLYQIEVSLDSLKKYQNIKLVDLPGLDSGDKSHDHMINSYIPKSRAFIIMFSADEPLIKESIRDFLLELKLNDIPVYAIMTKCDKVSKDILTASKINLKKDLRKLLNSSDAELFCINSKGDKDIEGLTKILDNLSFQADEIANKEVSNLLYDKCLTLQTALAVMLMGENLCTTDAQTELMIIEKRNTNALAEMDNAYKHFLFDISSCQDKVNNNLKLIIDDSLTVLKALISDHNQSAKSVRPMFKYTIKNSLDIYFIPLCRKYISEITSIQELNTHDTKNLVNQDFSQILTEIYEDVFSDKDNAISTKTMCIEILSSAQQQIQDIFDSSRNTPDTTADICAEIYNIYVPHISFVIKTYADKLKGIMDTRISERIKEYQALIDSLNATRTSEEEKRHLNIDQLNKDLDTVSSMLSELK